MSNVEYRCPHTNKAGERDCGNRLFAPPGGTKMQCRHHPENIFVQTEKGSGPDFFFIDEKGKTKSKDQLVGAEKIRAALEGEVGEITDLPPTPGQRLLRNVYYTLTNEEPDPQWNETRLSEEISEWQEAHTTNKSDSVAVHPDDTGEARSEVAEVPDWASFAEIPTDTGTVVAGIPAGKD